MAVSFVGKSPQSFGILTVNAFTMCVTQSLCQTLKRLWASDFVDVHGGARAGRVSAQCNSSDSCNKRVRIGKLSFGTMVPGDLHLGFVCKNKTLLWNRNLGLESSYESTSDGSVGHGAKFVSVLNCVSMSVKIAM